MPVDTKVLRHLSQRWRTDEVVRVELMNAADEIDRLRNLVREQEEILDRYRAASPAWRRMEMDTHD